LESGSGLNSILLVFSPVGFCFSRQQRSIAGFSGSSVGFCPQRRVRLQLGPATGSFSSEDNPKVVALTFSLVEKSLVTVFSSPKETYA
jgi:hypothetical protein